MRYVIYSKFDDNMTILKGRGELRFSTDDREEAIFKVNELKQYFPSLIDTLNEHIYYPDLDVWDTSWTKEPTKMYNIKLPPHLIEFAKQSGHGQVSKGVKFALSRYQEQPRPAPVVPSGPSYRSVRLTETEASKAREIGGGDVSVGVQKALMSRMAHEPMIFRMANLALINRRLCDRGSVEPLDPLNTPYDLKLVGLDIQLPDTLSVGGNLTIEHCHIGGRLPTTLSVGGDLRIKGTTYIRMPTSMWVMGMIYINDMLLSSEEYSLITGSTS